MESPTAQSSFPLRIALLWALLCGLCVGLLGWFTWQNTRLQLRQTRLDALQHEENLVVVKLQSAVSDAARDALFLSQLPTIQEFLQSPTGPDGSTWLALMEKEFAALLHGKPTYFQARLIGVANQGKEVLRLENTDGVLTVIPPERLQAKGDRDYFQETLKLKPGQVFISDINLNQEFGQVSQPHIPTLRVATQIHAQSSPALFGVVVINIDMRPLLKDLSLVPNPEVRLELANGSGDFLLHSNPASLYATDLQHGNTFAAESPPPPGDLVWSHERNLAPAWNSPRKIALRLQILETDLLAGWREIRNQAALSTTIAILLVAGLVGWQAHRAMHGLARAKLRAEEASQAKEEFLAQMSHEIRTPMNAVTGMISALERNDPPPRQAPMLKSLRAASTQLMGLLNDTLDWSKIRAGKIDFQEAAFSLTQLLDDVLLTHRPGAFQKGLKLHFQSELAPAEWVMGDALRLSQVLNNLLGNAIKFTEQGSVTLSVMQSRSEAAESGRQWLTFEVADTGPGVLPSDRERIFQPYRQSSSGAQQRQGSTGLGLAIARNLVELQGGKLELEPVSPATPGTTFRVQLPFTRALAHASDTVTSTFPTTSLKGAIVLYVEDVELNREVMVSLLAETGVQLHLAETGAAALVLVPKLVPQLVLIDLQLPDQTGLEVASKIRGLLPSLPMVAVTAQTLTATREACFRAGMQNILYKPINRNELLAVLSTSLKPPQPDFAGLQEIMNGNAERIRKVLVGLAEELPNMRDSLWQTPERERPALAKKLHHRLATTIGYLKLTALEAAFQNALDTERLARALQEVEAAVCHQLQE